MGLAFSSDPLFRDLDGLDRIAAVGSLSSGFALLLRLLLPDSLALLWSAFSLETHLGPRHGREAALQPGGRPRGANLGDRPAPGRGGGVDARLSQHAAENLARREFLTETESPETVSEEAMPENVRETLKALGYVQ